MSDALILAQGLVVERAGRRVLDVECFEVARGERVAVVGGNGAGKTTLLEVVALLAPTRGTVRIAGTSATSEAERVSARRRIGFVSTKPNLIDASVRANIALPLTFRGVARSEVAQRVEHAATSFGVGALLNRPASTVSAGEAARASLARAFVTRPEILMLDEPFARLDEPTRTALVRDFATVLQNLDVTVVFVTHDRSEAATVATRVVVLESGRIAQEGDPAGLLEHPHSRASARWAGFENIVAGRLLEPHAGHERVEVAPGIVFDCVGKRPASGDVAVCFRAEAVAVARSGDEIHGSMRNRFRARVVALAAGPGGTVFATLGMGEAGATILAALTRESVEGVGVSEGADVGVAIKATAIHVVS